MKNKLKLLWNKIKPLDYSKNPIGSLKLEVLFWLSLIYLSTTFTTLFEIIFIFGYTNFYISNWTCIILVFIAWYRIALKLNIFIDKGNK